MRRFVIGTAGHVDHGKTTLVHALTGVDTDRLPEEKRRGITIELGFAPLRLGAATPGSGDEAEVSIVDVPGHRRLVHTMIAGAAGIELVLVVVAADEGVMPQTREHLAACELLGIRRAIVAVTKLDRAGHELAALAGAEVAELMAGRFDVEVVVCSAKTGEGIEDVRAALRRALATLPAPEADGAAHLSVDRIFSVKGAGTVVTGTLTRGRLEVGQAIRVVGGASPLETAARGLHVHDRAVDHAEAPTRLAINLARGAVDDVERGFVVTADPEVARTRVLDVGLRLLGSPKPGATVEVYLGTARTTARFRWLAPAAQTETETETETEEKEGDESAGDAKTALVRLALATPIAARGGDRLVLRTSSARGPGGAVIGGGRVLDARPPAARRKALRVEALRAIERADETAAIRALCAEAAPRSVPETSLGGRFPWRSNDLARAAEKLSDKGELVRIKPGGWTPRANVVALAARALRLVEAHHAAHPLERGIALETLRQKLGASSDPGVAAESIRVAARRPPPDTLVVAGEIVHSARFGTEAPQAVASVVDAARVALHEAALKGLSEHQLGVATGLASRELRTLATRLVREGNAVAAGGLWFDARAIGALRDRVNEELAAANVLTIARFKDFSGLGRKQAIPLLELFDREGTTKRVGDDRVAGPAATPSGKAASS
jgi:selenocysteine-specific elongation factor